MAHLREVWRVSRGEDPSGDETSEEIQAFLQRMEATIGEVKMLRLSGTDAIGVSLSVLGDDTLKLLRDIVENKKSGHRYGTENKLAKVLPILYAPLNHLEQAKLSIVRAQKSLMMQAVELFVEEFNSYANGQANCDMAMFLAKIDREFTRRELAPEVKPKAPLWFCTIS